MNLALVFQSGDAVLIGVFLCLVIMSITTWVIIILRSIQHFRTRKANRNAMEAIYAAPAIDAAEAHAKRFPSPVSQLVLNAIAAHRRFLNAQHNFQAASLPHPAYLERELRHSMSKILNQFESGMTALATIGSTAPFIGLLGTVWGIYHALINISQTGQMSVAAVSGPIGEALVATAFGLFVAIPAVLAYNIFMRSNKNLSKELHHLAHDVHVQLIHTDKE